MAYGVPKNRLPNNYRSLRVLFLFFASCDVSVDTWCFVVNTCSSMDSFRSTSWSGLCVLVSVCAPMYISGGWHVSVNSHILDSISSHLVVYFLNVWPISFWVQILSH